MTADPTKSTRPSISQNHPMTFEQAIAHLDKTLPKGISFDLCYCGRTRLGPGYTCFIMRGAGYLHANGTLVQDAVCAALDKYSAMAEAGKTK